MRGHNASTPLREKEEKVIFGGFYHLFIIILTLTENEGESITESSQEPIVQTRLTD